ncbi:MAG TPA: hypothetical protein VKF15_02365 [Nitrososphaerales archaeon]|nr:hypothetical protein [Nitrososphaerales archaeon]
MAISHDGQAWRIYYYQISNLESELDAFGNFLEELEAKGESPTAILPDVGTRALSYARVVGFAVLVKKGNQGPETAQAP